MAQYSIYRPWASGPWASLDQLQHEIDALFDRRTRSFARAGRRGVYPPVNLYETSDAYVLTAELPGVEAGDIHVSIEGSTIILEGERNIDYGNPDDASLHRRERQSGSFRRALDLPAKIDADKVEAVQRHGVLMLRMPKSPEHQPRQIAVQAN